MPENLLYQLGVNGQLQQQDYELDLPGVVVLHHGWGSELRQVLSLLAPAQPQPLERTFDAILPNLNSTSFVDSFILKIKKIYIRLNI